MSKRPTTCGPDWLCEFSITLLFYAYLQVRYYELCFGLFDGCVLYTFKKNYSRMCLLVYIWYCFCYFAFILLLTTKMKKVEIYSIYSITTEFWSLGIVFFYWTFSTYIYLCEGYNCILCDTLFTFNDKNIYFYKASE